MQTLRAIEAIVSPDGRISMAEPIVFTEPTKVILTVMVDDDETAIEEEWRQEIRRRVKSIKDGTATLIDHEDAMARVREAVEQVRKRA